MRQVGFIVVEVIHFEKRRRALASRGCEDRRIHQREPVAVEIIAYGFNHFMPHTNNGVLPLGPEPQMPVVHQKFDAVLLRCDRIRICFRDFGRMVRALHVHLEAARRASFRAKAAPHNERRLLRQMLQFLKQLFGQFVFQCDALQQSGAVAQNGKNDLAGLAQVVEPAGDFDGLAHVTGGSAMAIRSGIFLSPPFRRV